MQLAAKDLEHRLDALLAERREPPDVRSSNANRCRAKRERLEDIGAAAEAAIHEHWHASRDSGGHLGHALNRRPQAVLGAPAMVGDEDAAHAVADRKLRVLPG